MPCGPAAAQAGIADRSAIRKFRSDRSRAPGRQCPAPLHGKCAARSSLLLEGALAVAEAKRLRYLLLQPAARITCGGRRLHFQERPACRASDAHPATINQDHRFTAIRPAQLSEAKQGD
ncbi:hypothetical protein C4B68_38765 [Streptomyces dengpaensis]|uniref:Uncharacterized protein n=1 Tax=Streptomyces dengpaensis TaxID=2049881 RepID=A0ABM6T152_9ACTN|nr:hypothetical protein C4B68_38765 [Streptomyces dengpaensis]